MFSGCTHGMVLNDCWLCPHVVTLHHPDPERTRHGPVQRVKPQPITWRDEPEMLIGNAVMGWPYPNPAFQKMLDLVELPLDWTGVVTGYIGIVTSTIFVRKQARNIVSGTTSVLLVLGGLNSDPWTMGLRSPQKCWVWVKLGTCTPVLISVGWFQSRNGGRTYTAVIPIIQRYVKSVGLWNWKNQWPKEKPLLFSGLTHTSETPSAIASHLIDLRAQWWKWSHLLTGHRSKPQLNNPFPASIEHLHSKVQISMNPLRKRGFWWMLNIKGKGLN